MDHRDFAAQLDAETRTALTARSDAAGLWHLAAHGGIIAGLMLWVGLSPLWALGLLPLGIALIFLFTLEHEATHKTPFASAALNEWVGRICGLILLLPFEWFRYFHLAHHRWTNLPGQDPELEGGKPATRRAWAWHVSGLPYWAAQIRLLTGLVRGDMANYVPPTARLRVRREARLMLGCYGLAALSLLWTDALLWFWVVPMLLGQPFLRLYLLAEHGDCPQVANMFANTRTTLTTGLVRLLAWNMPYHVEHHVLPQVPFHHLPALHGLMKGRLQVTADGYAAFSRDYLARRR